MDQHDDRDAGIGGSAAADDAQSPTSGALGTAADPVPPLPNDPDEWALLEAADQIDYDSQWARGEEQRRIHFAKFAKDIEAARASNAGDERPAEPATQSCLETYRNAAGTGVWL